MLLTVVSSSPERSTPQLPAPGPMVNSPQQTGYLDKSQSEQSLNTAENRCNAPDTAVEMTGMIFHTPQFLPYTLPTLWYE